MPEARAPPNGVFPAIARVYLLCSESLFPFTRLTIILSGPPLAACHLMRPHHMVSRLWPCDVTSRVLGNIPWTEDSSHDRSQTNQVQSPWTDHPQTSIRFDAHKGRFRIKGRCADDVAYPLARFQQTTSAMSALRRDTTTSTARPGRGSRL